MGPALGQHGVNIMDFVKAYNERTASMAGDIAPAQISIYQDRSFTFEIRTPPASDLIRKAAGIDKGSSTARREMVGTISPDQARQIAEKKMPDLNANDIEGAIKIVAGTARSMGIQVSDSPLVPESPPVSE